MSRVPDVVELLRALVACPSVSPGDAAVVGAPLGEGRLCELLRELLAGWGAEVDVQTVAPGRTNVVARFEGRRPERSIAFEAHADTVSGAEMTVAPFEPSIRGGRLYGRGACDTKASIAAMLTAIARVVDRDGRPPLTTYFVSTCDEEIGASGVRALLAGGFRADAVVVGEPTDLRIVHAHRGAVRWVVTTRGVAGHSSKPSGGVNAIYRMRKVLEAIELPLASALASRVHPVAGAPTVSVGTIAGGTQVNMIPASCRIEVDRRTVPGEDAEGATAELGVVLGGVPEVEIVTRHSFPPLESAVDSPLAKAVAAACRAVAGAAEFVAAPWASNAGFFAAAGMPCVLVGPGSSAQAHTADEYVEIDSLRAACDVYGRIIAGFAGG